MHDWIEHLPPGQRVLDLGAGAGSLKAAECSSSMVAVDCDREAFTTAYQPNSVVQRVLALSESLPFASSVFDLVLCHHVLEHVANLQGSLAEVSRVLKPEGRLYVAVPNGYGLCDGIYRYVFEGGDHVNRFERQAFIDLLENSVGVRLTGWQKLYSSFAYLARLKDLDRQVLPKLAPRLRRLARVPRPIVALLQSGLYLFTRMADRIAGVDWALYGWALYFEHTGDRTAAIAIREDPPFVNVCLYCGSGRHPARELIRYYKVLYRCPTCSHIGIYFPPFRNAV
jgi:SAM-dependent methyltransferase